VAISPEMPVDQDPPVAMEPAGSTLGVEEEFHLVDPDTLALAPSPALSEAALRREFGGRIHP
jgi:hypothetical protein